MKTPDYLSDEELEVAMQLYDITDREMQVTAVGYMYGMPDRKQAETLLDGLPEEKVADSYDYYLCYGLPLELKVAIYNSLKERRESIMEEYSIGAIDAVVKRQELEYEDFAKAVASVPVQSNSLEQ